jgi:hypothetical protein
MNIEQTFRQIIDQLQEQKISGKFANSGPDVELLFLDVVREFSATSQERSSKARNFYFSVAQDYSVAVNSVLGVLLINRIEALFSSGFTPRNSDFYSIEGRTEAIGDSFTALFQKVVRSKESFRLGDPLPPDISISKEAAAEYFSFLVDMVQARVVSPQDGGDQTVTTQILLVLGNSLNLISERNRWEFYQLAYLVVQTCNHHGEHQRARDLSEQVYLSSQIDNLPTAGLYVLYNCYLMQRNIVDSLGYLAAFFISLDETTPLKVWKSSLLSAQVYFRELRLEPLQDRLFQGIGKHLGQNLDIRERDQLHLCNFASKFGTGIDISVELEIYLNGNKEDIFQIGVDALNVWYVLLSQVQIIFPNTQIGNYILYFRRCIGSAVLRELDTKLGLITDWQAQYNKLVSGLEKSRYHRDRASELKLHKVFLNEMIMAGFRDKDPSLILNAFRLLSDVTEVSDESPAEGEVSSGYASNAETRDFYSDFQNSLDQIDLCGNSGLLVAKLNTTLGLMLINAGPQKFRVLDKDWSLSDFRKILETLETLMVFDPDKDDSDFAYQQWRLEQQVSILSAISLDDGYPTPRFFVGDADTTGFPANLAVANGAFLLERGPVFTVPSLDFLLRHGATTSEASVSLWCPKENGDIQLNLVWQYLEPTFEKFSISVDTKMESPKTMTSGIAVIVAHGADDIDETKMIGSLGRFGASDYHYEHVENLVGNAKIVIMFVCHSGRSSKDRFYELSQSMLRSFFSKGVEVIIAPRWPLSISVPPIWLPVFLTEFRSGQSALVSSFIAATEVRKIHPNAGAWSCLHYFGNPNVVTKNIAS